MLVLPSLAMAGAASLMFVEFGPLLTVETLLRLALHPPPLRVHANVAICIILLWLYYVSYWP